MANNMNKTTRNAMISTMTAVAGAVIVKSMQNNKTRRKLKKAVNKAFDTVTDSVQSMNMK